MISKAEIEKVIESFGLVKENRGNYIYGRFGDFYTLLYYKETGEACVYEYNYGFSNSINKKRAVIWKMRQLFKDIKEAKLRIKLQRIEEDFE